jgi:hypothetical protein
LWFLEQRLRTHSGKYDAYLYSVAQQQAERNTLKRIEIANDLLHQPDLSRMQSWAEYQRRQNRLA